MKHGDWTPSGQEKQWIHSSKEREIQSYPADASIRSPEGLRVHQLTLCNSSGSTVAATLVAAKPLRLALCIQSFSLTASSLCLSGRSKYSKWRRDSTFKCCTGVNVFIFPPMQIFNFHKELWERKEGESQQLKQQRLVRVVIASAVLN